MAGTTRDVVSQTIQIQGVPLHVADTAGPARQQRRGRADRRGPRWGQIDRRRRGAVPARPDPRRAARPTRRRMPRSCARLQSRSRGGRAGARCLEQAGRGVVAAHRPAAWRCLPRRATASRRCASACWKSPAGRRCPKALYLARARHVARPGAVERAPGAGRRAPAAPAPRARPAGRGAAPGAERPERDHRRIRLR